MLLDITSWTSKDDDDVIKMATTTWRWGKSEGILEEKGMPQQRRQSQNCLNGVQWPIFSDWIEDGDSTLENPYANSHAVHQRTH